MKLLNYTLGYLILFPATLVAYGAAWLIGGREGVSEYFTRLALGMAR